MKYFVVGGGSGGHLTPLLAVAQAIKKKDSSATVVHVGQKGDNLQEIVEDSSIDGTSLISAGKFRRYHGESFIAHILDVKTIALNIRDFFKFLVGLVQAWILLGKEKPDAIFLKGGFVCVPVGYAARLRRIAYITHDSDAVPGLANRLTAKHAVYNTTALASELYPYEPSKTIQVGIPIQAAYRLVSTEDTLNARNKLNVPKDADVILSVGGGLGARRLNKAVVTAVEKILTNNSNIIVFHMSGKSLFTETKALYQTTLDDQYAERVRVIDFTKELYLYSSAADVIISRAGATNIAEFAAQGKPCIFVPNPVLTGGQQLHNAKILEGRDAAIILPEEKLADLSNITAQLLSDEKKQRQLSQNIHDFVVDGSAAKIADLLIGITESNENTH